MSCRPPSSVTLGRLSVKLLASNCKIADTKWPHSQVLQKTRKIRINANDVAKVTYQSSALVLLQKQFYNSHSLLAMLSPTPKEDDRPTNDWQCNVLRVTITANKCRSNKPAACLDSCMPNKRILQALACSVQRLHHTLNAHICTRQSRLNVRCTSYCHKLLSLYCDHLHLDSRSRSACLS